MLYEFRKVQQKEKGYRRLFLDEFFDLYVWYDKKGGDIIGFELCYNKDSDEHSIIWKQNKGYLHTEIDSGENNPGHSKQSPISLIDGYFDKKKVSKRFLESSLNLENEIVDLVNNRILEYDEKLINPFL
ncbi:MAG: hypothetical protein JEZ04_05435 [Spirochaetales bacterium]|nr:hypothetical protein [Spirochaetales bacterium]